MEKQEKSDGKIMKENTSKTIKLKPQCVKILFVSYNCRIQQAEREIFLKEKKKFTRFF